MALTITSTLTTPEGIEVTNGYGRVAVVNSIYGNRIEAGVDIFKDAAAFEDGKQPFQFQGISLVLAAAYDYGTDERNILDLGHDLLITHLADQGITATKNL